MPNNGEELDWHVWRVDLYIFVIGARGGDKNEQVWRYMSTGGEPGHSTQSR